MGRFDGAVALVTGAATGIGRATAIAFAREGARVVVADVADEEAQHTLAMVLDAGAEGAFVHTDVSRAADVASLVDEAVRRFGSLDVAINNAGIEGARAPLVDMDEADFDRVIGVNLKGVWLCMREELRVMTARGRGVIANTASIQGLHGVGDMSAYGASKGGVIALTRHVAREVAPVGIRVNCVCPGTIRTPMYDRSVRGDGDEERRAGESAWLGRIGEPEEIAGVFLWLCSDDASYVTGQPIVIDGSG